MSTSTVSEHHFELLGLKLKRDQRLLQAERYEERGLPGMAERALRMAEVFENQLSDKLQAYNADYFQRRNYTTLEPR